MAKAKIVVEEDYIEREDDGYEEEPEEEYEINFDDRRSYHRYRDLSDTYGLED